MGVIKGILENIGSLSVLDRKRIENNIRIIREYGIRLGNDDEGYRILAMCDLKEKIEYLFEKNAISKGMDLNQIRKVIISEDYKACKNMGNYDKIDFTSKLLGRWINIRDNYHYYNIE